MRLAKRIVSVSVLTSYVLTFGTCFSSQHKTSTVDAHAKKFVEETVTTGSSIKVTPVETEKPVQKKVKRKVKYLTGWTKTSVNVRKKPSVKSDILDTYSFNEKIRYYKLNKKWAKIKYNDTEAYMCIDYISNHKVDYRRYEVPSTSGFKSYMSYKCITSTGSEQYKLQHQRAYTGKYGIRQVDDRFCVALGSYFASKVGTLFDLILENGTVIPCILSDQKADEDTDSQNIVTEHNGCMSEFIVDLNSLAVSAKRQGDISYCNKKWNSPVKYVKVYKNKKDINVED